MVWNTILNTRESSIDYLFHLLPEYVSTKQHTGEKRESMIRQFIRNMEDFSYQIGENVMLENWHDTLVFFYDKDAYYLLRYAKTPEQDDRGRVIFTTEGLVCPREREKEMLLELPNAVLYLLSDKELLRTRYFGQQLSETIDVPHKINWLGGIDGIEGVECITSNYMEQLQRLSAILDERRKPFPFVLGSMASKMQRYMENMLDADVMDISSAVQLTKKDTIRKLQTEELWASCKIVPVKLWCKLSQEEGQDICWQWEGIDENAEIVATSVEQENTKVKLSQWKDEVFLMEQYLKYHGYEIIK